MGHYLPDLENLASRRVLWTYLAFVASTGRSSGLLGSFRKNIFSFLLQFLFSAVLVFHFRFLKNDPKEFCGLS